MRISTQHIFILFLSLTSILTYSQEEELIDEKSESEAEELAKKLANPIASLISIPFQNNTDFGIGDLEGTRNTLNIQPVVPIKLSDNLNLITRYIFPIVTQYNITEPGSKQSGLSDAVVSAFFSPSNSEKLTWGVGPVFLLPIGSNDYLTADQFGVGPTAVALTQTNGWTIGGLINQIWSVSSDENKPDINQMFLQPFIIYNWKTGAGLGANIEWTQNWESNQSTIWLNPTFSAVSALGKQKFQLVIGPRFNLDAPDGARADLGGRAVLIFLFPK
ncbi:hypothetical protein OO013_08440 [Mangrovivirga sp. M17]|uniref:Transporter n=1 Tax=Mangrovivirga halotolerans TaxID=2993936 RepID=A0ABT3RQ16_9BACT|nr:hypothetical protein [Mangrovivirga halotolerans]MCX2743891.1 hypothetical protein [Mangrovivirga halotolerans]